MTEYASIMDAYARIDGDKQHRSGAFPTSVLREVERLLPHTFAASAETGCGKSTVLFSCLSQHHTTFCLDDRNDENGSVSFYEQCSMTHLDRVHPVFGPTQLTLPSYRHPHTYDVVLIDGPHGWPMPEIEYWHLYPHIRCGGLLIVDDVIIPTIGHLADVLAEDRMWDLIGVVASTALFRRTDAPLFDPLGDGWWTQRFNQRRVSKASEAYLDDGGPRHQVTSAVDVDGRIRVASSAADRVALAESQARAAEVRAESAEKQVAAAELRIQEALDAAAAADERSAQAESQAARFVEDIYTSTSWRVTRPLRFAKRLLTPLRR